MSAEFVAQEVVEWPPLHLNTTTTRVDAWGTTFTRSEVPQSGTSFLEFSSVETTDLPESGQQAWPSSTGV